MKKAWIFGLLFCLPALLVGQSVLDGLVPSAGFFLPPFGEYRRPLAVRPVEEAVREAVGVKLGVRAWDYASLSLFCRLEVQVERVVRWPVRIRLGDVDYVDWLEGKRRN
jgi:hypothetical protein